MASVLPVRHPRSAAQREVVRELSRLLSALEHHRRQHEAVLRKLLPTLDRVQALKLEPLMPPIPEGMLVPLSQAPATAVEVVDEACSVCGAPRQDWQGYDEADCPRAGDPDGPCRGKLVGVPGRVSE